MCNELVIIHHVCLTLIHFHKQQNTHAHTPTYITHTAQEASVTKEESERPWQPICKYALEVLLDLHIRIECGNISIHELHEIHSKEKQMFKLYSATAVVDRKKRVNLPSANTIVTNMNQRFKEYKLFLVYLQRLKHMLFLLKPERLPGNFFNVHACAYI